MNAPTSASPSVAARGRPRRFQEAGLVAVILLLGLFLSVFGGRVAMPLFETNAEGERVRVFRTTPEGEREPVLVERNKFFNAKNLTQLAKDTSFIAIMAVGATMIIISGGIDLSVGSIYALASVVGALVFNAWGPTGSHGDASGWVGAVLGGLACLAMAVGCGLINGSMVVTLGVHPFIITLGTMAIYRGVAFVATKGQSVGDFPARFRDLVRWESSGGLSLVPLGVMLVVGLVGGVFLARMAAGRRIYAIGGNELASRYSGIRVERVKLGVYLWSGLTAGIASLVALGYYGSASSGDGAGYELDVIAAAVVGGASLSGGKGTALGALLGALVIKMIDNGIVILEIDQNYSRIIIGVAVILAVVLDRFNAWWFQRRGR